MAWFADRGVTVERVLSDNGSCYRSFAWREACAGLGITPEANTSPIPAPDQRKDLTSSSRTMADGWAYARRYRLRPPNDETHYRGGCHFYNHHRIHSAIGGTPISRLNNLPGHHS